MEITTYKGHWWIAILMAFALVLAIAVGLIVSPVSADVFIYGSLQNYSIAVLPNNSYVHQGENISQGYYYSLLGVYGFSGELAHWNNDDRAGMDTPDQIVVLEGHGYTYIDPAKFPVGRWWQWDGKSCDSSGLCVTGFGHGNPYVFAVVKPQYAPQNKTIIRTSNITISQNGTMIQIPVTYAEVVTYYGTPVPVKTPIPIPKTQTDGVNAPNASGTIVVPTPTPISTTPAVITDVQDQNGIQIPGGVGAVQEVTAKAPLPVVVPAMAIALTLLVFRRKK
jgi:hypothetical protein